MTLKNIVPFIRNRDIFYAASPAVTPKKSPMPISNDPALSRLDPDSNAFDEIPGRTSPVRTQGFLRTWFASSADLRSTADTNDVEWGIHWVTPASVILLFVLGTLSAIGHHFHYAALHDTRVGSETQQRWASWIGSGFSFFTKVTLTAALGISRTQWVWLTLRKKWLTLRGIDAVFGVTSDPTYFTNALMLKRAKAATIIAISMWMIPIAAILTPGTISVDQFPDTRTFPCSVGSLRFPFDHNSTAIIRSKLDPASILPIVDVAVWSEGLVPPVVRVSQPVMRTLISSAYTGSIGRAISLPAAGSPSATTVGEKCGANCSYNIEFLGPSVTCTPFTSWKTVRWDNESMFMLERTYYGDAAGNNTDSILLGIRSRKEPAHPIIIKCRSSTARYNVEYVVVERNFLEPKITKVEPNVLAGLQATAKYPDPTYLSQAVLMYAFSKVLYGGIQTGYGTTTAMTLTPLVEIMTKRPMDMGTAVEQLGHKMVVSLVASDLLLDGSAFLLDVTATQDTMCTTTTYNLLYVYSARTLILVYALAVACALVTTLAGFFALRQNGMASTQTPSSMIRTTRNPTLDEAIVGNYTLGGNTMSDEMEKMELRFGALRADAKGSVHYALGVRGEISPIKQD